MKTIIIVGYLSGIVYQILCTDLIKVFANGSKEVFDDLMENVYIIESKTKLLKLIADLTMFVLMIITAALWPIGVLCRIVIKSELNIEI